MVIQLDRQHIRRLETCRLRSQIVQNHPCPDTAVITAVPYLSQSVATNHACVCSGDCAITWIDESWVIRGIDPAIESRRSVCREPVYTGLRGPVRELSI